MERVLRALIPLDRLGDRFFGYRGFGDDDTPRHHEIDHGDEHTEQENVLKAKVVPDDAAQQGHADGKNMVDTDGCGKRWLDIRWWISKLS